MQKRFYLLAVILGLVESFLVYSLSSVYTGLMPANTLGYFIAVSAIALLIFLTVLPKLVVHLRPTLLLRYFLAINLLSSLSLIFVQGVSMIVAALSILIIFTGAVWVALDILLEKTTPDVSAGRVRGTYLSMMSIGLLIGPFLITSIKLGDAQQSAGYVLSVLYAVILSVSSLIVKEQENAFSPSSIISPVDFKKLFDISMGVEVFRNIMLVYIPVHMQSAGFTWTEIGMTASVVMLLYVVLQTSLGRMSDRFHRERAYIIICLVIAALATFLLAVSVQDKIFLALLYIAASISVASVEVFREAYFYRQIDGNDISLITKLRTTRPIGQLIAAAMAAIMLNFFPIPAVFMATGVILLLAAYPAYRLRGTHS